jgi:hypothetical protein
MRSGPPALLAVALTGCGLGGGPGAGDPGTTRLFADRVWLDTGSDAAPGSFRAFLSDGTLIMASCVETYRLAAWRWTRDGIAWDEEVEVRAEIAAVGPDELVLVLDLVGGPETRSYRLAAAPVTCSG